MEKDRGLWITWYDLPDAGREDHVRWVHETYIPTILKRPGILWAAHYEAVKKEALKTMNRGIVRKHGISLEGVPQGDRYILMFAAEHAHVFGDPVPSELNASLPEADRKMLAMRVDARRASSSAASTASGRKRKA